MGDLARSTEPKMSSKATVLVTDRLEQGHSRGVYSGKIATLIGDMRVGHETFSFDSSNGQEARELLHKTEYEVVVPCDSVLHIEVDRQFETSSNNQRVKHLQLLKLPNGTSHKSHQVDEHHQVEVNISWSPESILQQTDEQEFIISPPQPPRPVEVKIVSGKHLTVVYTIDDAVSFTEFIMTLRRILADHPGREDILDGHDDMLNLSSTREHPVLTRTRSEQPDRWLHVKLQAKHDNQISWTTLLMRDDDLYVHGFMNKQGVVYELLDDNRSSDHMLPVEEYRPKRLDWTVEYKSMLGTQTNDEVVEKLMRENLGHDFAVKAVRVLSSHPARPDNAPHIELSTRVALAGLIVIVCESARMNPIHNAFACRWKDGDGFNGELMNDYVWKYTNMSKKLLSWKKGKYKHWPRLATSQVRSKQLQAIYLVRNIPPDLKAAGPGGGGGADNAGQGDKPTDGASSSGNTGRGGDTTGGPAPAGAGQSTEGSMQDEKDGDSKSPSQHGEAADEVQGQGRPRVELLALTMHPDFLVVDDGKRGQIIYRKEEPRRQEQKRQQEDEGRRQEGQGMVDLVLTGPYRGISAEYGCFAIKIDIPKGTTSTSSGSDERRPPIKWEWDCDDPDHAAQVDTMQPAHGIISSLEGRKVAEVTYAVMSDAREATVQVGLQLKSGLRPVGASGKVTALIDGFDVPSVLFSCTEEMGGQCLSSSTDGGSWFLLELARNVVVVPRGRVLHIVVHLKIEADDGKKVEVNVPLRFENGICSSKTDDSKEVKVEVTWYPEVKMVSGHHPTVVYTIADELSFIGFIMALRGILADHPDREDILDRHHSSIRSSATELYSPVLAKQRAEQPARWIHVKLQAVNGEETLSTTLLMRDDNLFVCGFMNQQGVVYELIENPARSADILPVDEYNPRRLSWGVHYRSLLDANTEHELLTRLAWVKMGRDFAMDAVRVLSGFPDWVNGKMNPRVALAGLMFMVCESARIDRVKTFFANEWTKNECFEHNELRDYVFNYRRTSHQLLMWKSRGYDDPYPMLELKDIYLVLNYRLNPPQASSSTGRGRPRVELLAMRADIAVDGTTVIVFDGKRGHIIYMKEEQEEKGIMVDLVLAGPYTSISASGCFAIKIDIPPGTAAGSSKGDAGGSIKWEWDCYDPEYADEVDKPPVTRTISSSGPGRNVEVTYAVMTNALQATVQVNLRTKDGNSPCSVHGDITACIGDFKHKSILFRRTKETAQHFSPMMDSPQVILYQLMRSLKLARNVVAVPCGEMLRIGVDLQIQTCKNQGPSKKTHVDDTLRFSNGIWSQHRKVDDVDVEVNIAWYPGSFSDSSERSPTMEIEEKSQRQPDISYTVGDDAEGFSRFITELRRLAAEHPRCKDLMADHPQLSSTHNHPVLPKGRDRRKANVSRPQMKPEMLFHIKLEAVNVGVETSSITLVMRGYDLEVIGFIKKNRDCYELRFHDDKTELPPEYKSRSLPWHQGGILLEDSTRLGKIFLEDAVRVLSRFEYAALIEYRQALSVLMVMVHDSARIEPVRDAIAGGWNNKDGMELTKQLKAYRWKWQEISGALLDWRDHAYQGWPQKEELERIGIKSPEDALKVVPLVFNDQNRITYYQE